MAAQQNQPRPRHPLPGYKFPPRTFGKGTRRFQASWFGRFPWLDYECSSDLVYCFTCTQAVKQGKLTLNGLAEPSFLSKGFSNWKDAIRIFVRHESSGVHKQAVSALSLNTRDIGELLSSEYSKEKRDNQAYLLHVISTIRFLARQGLPLRGDDDEKESNFYQLLLLRAEDCPVIKSILQKKQLKYTSHEIQNELLSVMAKMILRKITTQLQSSYFTVMIDETADISNKEQVVIVFRWIEDDLKVNEEFVGLYQTESIQASTLVAIIEDTLLRFNLKIEQCRGQCYDGASVMTGVKTGVATIISQKERRAVFTHCYGHALNLAVSDTVKQCKIMKDSLSTVYEIMKLIKKSPKRDALFLKLKEQLSPEKPGVRVLCPTRWTVRGTSLQSIIDNYEVLLALWEESKDMTKEAEMRARIIGVESQMLTFNFLFGVSLGSLLLIHSDNLSKTLQHTSISASEGQHIARQTLQVLQSLREPDKFVLFFERVKLDQKQFNLPSPSLPRKRRAPQHIEVGNSSGDFHDDVECYYRAIYYEAIDLVMEAVKNRFNQPGYRLIQNIEGCILKACLGENYSEDLEFVCNFYNEDLDKSLLTAQLKLLKPVVDTVDPTMRNIHEIVKILLDTPQAQRVALSQVFTLLKLLLILPATNATSERSFSALRRVKTYLRSTMNQERLNDLMLLHVHKSETDTLDLISVAKEFVASKEQRKTMFGIFN